MLYTLLRKLFMLFVVLGAAAASAQTCSDCLNIDVQTKGSRWPAFGTDSGTANAYNITTVAPLGPTLRTGSQVMFFAANANTGASTAVVDGSATIPIKKNVSVALAGGEILANGITILYYDGTNFQISGSGSSLGTAPANSYWGNPSNSSGAGSYNQINGGSSCGDSTHALNYTAGTGFGCQTLSGGGGGSFSSPLTEVFFTSSSRVSGTAYQNTSGGPLLVIAVGTGVSNLVQCITDSSSTPTQIVDSRDVWHGTGGDSSCAMIVANSNYYKCVCGTVAGWREWTFAKGTISIAGDLSSNGSNTRAAGSIYHNTGSNPILVIGTFTSANATSGAHPLQGLADTSSTPTTIVWQDDPPSSGSFDHVMFWVLPGEFYEVNGNSNGGTLYRWYEYTWSGVTATKQQAVTSAKFNRCVGTTSGGGFGSTNCYMINVSSSTILWPQIQGTGGSGGDRMMYCGGNAPTYQYDAVTSGQIESVACIVQPMSLYMWVYNTGSGAITAWWEWSIG